MRLVSFVLTPAKVALQTKDFANNAGGAGGESVVAMFVTEFLRGIIESNMEDPRVRDAKVHDHMYKVKATADKL